MSFYDARNAKWRGIKRPKNYALPSFCVRVTMMRRNEPETNKQEKNRREIKVSSEIIILQWTFVLVMSKVNDAWNGFDLNECWKLKFVVVLKLETSLLLISPTSLATWNVKSHEIYDFLLWLNQCFISSYVLTCFVLSYSTTKF